MLTTIQFKEHALIRAAVKDRTDIIEILVGHPDLDLNIKSKVQLLLFLFYRLHPTVKVIQAHTAGYCC